METNAFFNSGDIFCNDIVNKNKACAQYFASSFYVNRLLTANKYHNPIYIKKVPAFLYMCILQRIWKSSISCLILSFDGF